MAYIGKQPTIGAYKVLDSITTSATDTFALTSGGDAYYPASANHCIVSLNGVIQAPIASFTISGSNIVFASALTTSDVIDFIQVLGDVLNIGTPSDGTVGIAKLSATGTPSSSTFLRGDNTWQSAGANTPAFHAYPTGGRQSISNGTFTKVTMTAESFDTDNAFDSVTNYRFTVPTGKGGKYFIYWGIGIFFASNNGFESVGVIYKNGSQYTNEAFAPTYPTGYMRHGRSMNSGTFDLSAGDYLELYARQQNNSSSAEGIDSASALSAGTWGSTYFGGYKIIE